MMDRGPDRLVPVMREPHLIAGLTLRDWDLLVPQARSSGLLARLAILAEASVGLAAVPQRVQTHLRSALKLAEKHRRDTLFELDRIADTLRSVVPTVILLKGAAYMAADLPPAPGRLFTDIDILVPKESLPAVEQVLEFAGWRCGEIN